MKLCKDCDWCEMYRHEIRPEGPVKVLLLPGDWLCQHPSQGHRFGMGYDPLTGESHRSRGCPACVQRSIAQGTEGHEDCGFCWEEGIYFKEKK